jgi:hypothetical protein
MKPYKPSNIAPASGVQLTLLISILSAVLSGGILSFIAKFFYLIVLFPAVLGGAIGFATSVGGNQGKVRNPLIAGGIAAIAALVGYGSLHFGQYLTFKQSFTEEIAQQSGGTPAANIDELIDEVLTKETGNKGFVGYVQFTAKQGMEITRSRGGSGIKLDETFTYIYWLIELAIIEGIAIWIAAKAAREPFCEQSQDWYQEPGSLASAALENQDQLIKALNTDDYAIAATFLKPEGEIAPPCLDLTIQLSPDPNQDRYLIVQKTSVNHKQQKETKVLLEGLISAKQQAELVEVLNSIETEEKVEIENSGENSQI